MTLVSSAKRKPSNCFYAAAFCLHLFLIHILRGVSGDEAHLFSVEEWLHKYGYLPHTDPRMSVLRSTQTMNSAIAAMQRIYGLNITGTLDEHTKDWMQRPRCGVPDTMKNASRSRKRRYALTGQKWQRTHITYRESQRVSASLGLWRCLQRAAALEEVSMLHADTSANGSTGVSRGGLVPQGQLEDRGNDLFLVAVHELGHALGLEHSNDPTAIMAPFYQYMDTENFKLPHDDLQGIQKIYGPPDRSPQPTRPPPTASPPRLHHPPSDPRKHERQVRPHRPPQGNKPTNPNAKPNICDGGFNTLAILRQELFVFKDQWFWRVRDNSVVPGYPMQINYFWRGLPSKIDAVYENSEGKFVFFKGNRFWVFKDTTLQPTYPQDISLFGNGMPTQSIETAVWWEDVAKTYFFKGDRYWRYNEDMRTMDPGYPKPIGVWKGIPDSPQGAFVDKAN
ncbi:unnamed protein product, partial [Arctogadus glacialis]